MAPPPALPTFDLVAEIDDINEDPHLREEVEDRGNGSLDRIAEAGCR
jgi:hypothetical protein